MEINGFRPAPSRLLLMPRHGPSVAFAGIARVGRDFWQALKEVLVATAEADSQKKGTKGKGRDRTQPERRVAKPAADRYLCRMSTLAQTLHAEIDASPERVLEEVLDFLVFLKSRHAPPSEGRESLLPLAGSAWDADWNTPQEDEAWRGL